MSASSEKVSNALNSIQSALEALEAEVSWLKENAKKIKIKSDVDSAKIEEVEKNVAALEQHNLEKDIVITELIPNVQMVHYVEFFLRQFKLESTQINNVFWFNKKGFQGEYMEK